MPLQCCFLQRLKRMQYVFDKLKMGGCSKFDWEKWDEG